ncbi:MAG: VWA domain-containing protein, partial [Bryobacteraceae bacterium]|nr:VWA domain-containing protein [Bryobacteraceae bacterium]
FALSLRPTGDPPPRGATDVVVMFDTSASQQGEYRTRALEALQALLDSLGPNDRVLLMGVDLNAVPLSEGFVAPESGAMEQALAQLRQRVPLGSTDMGAVTSAAVEQFAQARPGVGKAIVYIGDGMSTANLIQAGELRELADRLASQHVSVTSFGIGPQRDDQVMAVLANLSGGMLIVDTAETSAQEVGEKLAQYATAPVLWTQQTEFPQNLPAVYPLRPLPLRYERDSVYVGRINAADLAKPQALQISVAAEGLAEPMRWTVVPEAPHQDLSFLARVVKAAEADGGLSLPTLGSEGLFALNWMVNTGANNLAALAQQALALGNLDQAERLAREVLRSDPQHPQAESILNAVAKARHQQADAPRDMRLANFAQAAEEPAGARETSAAGEAAPDLDLEGQDGAFVDKVTKDIEVSTQRLQAEVQVGINEARQTMGTDPAAARDKLRQLRDYVRKAVDVSADVRAQLNRQIEEAIRAADREHVRANQESLLREQARAEAAAQEQINRRLYLTQQKAEQLMERFNSLLDEERYKDAEAVAAEAKEMLPETPEMTTGVLTARNVGYTKLMDALRDQRHRGLVDSLYAVEVSHVPTPDEPPILYPPAEVWRDLTERRRKYKSVDLSLSNPQRDRIKAALEEETEVDFDDTPISEVLEYLSDKHEIEIFMHKEELEQNSTPVDESTPITLHVKNVKLKSALRLMLRPLEATYVIDEETDVLLITSKAHAETLLVTRVYPVADLVVPIISMGMGMMGGMMGMGGMGMGGMGGGFGGGFLSVPPEQPVGGKKKLP